MTFTRTSWRSEKKCGPQPLCRECGREEVAAGGGVCVACRNRLAYQNKAAAEKLKACHEIAERLYKKDRLRFKDLFVWINTQVKKRKSLTQVLHCIERLESLNPSTFEPLNSSTQMGPRGEVWAYLEGTLRRLEERGEAGKLRAGRGPTAIGDIQLNLRALARLKQDK